MKQLKKRKDGYKKHQELRQKTIDESGKIKIYNHEIDDILKISDYDTQLFLFSAIVHNRIFYPELNENKIYMNDFSKISKISIKTRKKVFIEKMYPIIINDELGYMNDDMSVLFLNIEFNNNDTFCLIEYSDKMEDVFSMFSKKMVLL